MSDTDTSTHPILSSYTATPLDGYNVTFDGFGGVRGMIEYNGNVYDFRAHRLYRWRVVKLVHGQPDEVVASGASAIKAHEGWMPSDFGLVKPPGLLDYFLALEVELADNEWTRADRLH